MFVWIKRRTEGVSVPNAAAVPLIWHKSEVLLAISVMISVRGASQLGHGRISWFGVFEQPETSEFETLGDVGSIQIKSLKQPESTACITIYGLYTVTNQTFWMQ